jgi:hypothetical protein
MDLHVELRGDEIVVTRPGTDFMTLYRKRPNSPNLVLTRSWLEPTVSSPEISEFRGHAFQAAVSKARELGWGSPAGEAKRGSARFSFWNPERAVDN